MATRPALVFLAGGPGTAIVEVFGPGVTGALARDLTAGRDFVLFDQRGVGQSQPSLNCPELGDAPNQLREIHRVRGEDADDFVAAAFACRDRLVTSGIDLAAYTTAANAADVDDIRVALGYKRVDLWGLSYGTRLALEVAREFPAAVHSLVLESALPPSVNQVVDRAANAERAFRVLFGSCAADLACASAYPDLENVFYDLVGRLNGAPISIPAQSPRTGEVLAVMLHGDGLVRLLIDALADTVLIPFVPLAIGSLQHGDATLISQAISLLWLSGNHSSGMFYSVNCSDQVNRTSLERVLAAGRTVRPEINAALSEEARFRICAGWGAARVSRSAAAPVVSDVPALILAGEYDPLTPPRYGRIAGRTLQRSLRLTFPGIGHGVQRTAPCAHAIMVAFLAAPGQPPDAGCIADMRSPAWVIPGALTGR